MAARQSIVDAAPVRAWTAEQLCGVSPAVSDTACRERGSAGSPSAFAFTSGRSRRPKPSPPSGGGVSTSGASAARVGERSRHSWNEATVGFHRLSPTQVLVGLNLEISMAGSHETASIGQMVDHQQQSAGRNSTIE